MGTSKPKAYNVFLSQLERVRSLKLEGYSVKGIYELLDSEGIFDYSQITFARCFYKAKKNGHFEEPDSASSTPTSAEPSPAERSPASNPTEDIDTSSLDETSSDYQDKLAESIFKSRRKRL